MVYAKNVERIGYSDLDGRAGFKLAMQEIAGRFFLYASSFWDPGFMILDVTDPEHPELLRFIPAPPNTWALQVQAADGRLVTNLEHVPAGWGNGIGEPLDGFVVWDASDPADPKPLGTWSTGGTGTHRNYYAGGRYVWAAANFPGFVGRILAAVDINDPERPHTIGRWWHSGQNVAAGEVFSEHDQHKRTSGRPEPTESISLHGGAWISGDRAYCPWERGGMTILDISDPTSPSHVSTLDFYPPLGSSNAVHTVIPLPERGIALVNNEALAEKRAEPLGFAGVVDIRDESDPMLISLFPLPERPAGTARDYFRRGGRFGPHNQHQHQGQACLEPTGDTVYLTYFNAGLQIYDISDPWEPTNVGYYIPDEPLTRRGPKPSDLVVQVEDVLVDRRGFIFISEKNTGITVLRRT